MRDSLELARPRRYKRVRLAVLAAAGIFALWWGLPRLAAALPAGRQTFRQALGNWLSPRYTEELTTLQQQNASLHQQLALAETALAENEAMRRRLGCQRSEGSWQPARVVAHYADSILLACDGWESAPVTDSLGRYAGRVTAVNGDGTCLVSFAGSEDAPCAGLSGTAAGLLHRGKDWQLTGLPADCGLTVGSVVTTPEGYWLGALSAPPVPDSDGLTATAALTDTADLSATVFFVKCKN